MRTKKWIAYQADPDLEGCLDPLRCRRGLTLLELLIVIGIIAVLFSLSVAGVMRVREAAYTVQSKNNLHQIMLAVHQFAAVHNGNLPLAGHGPQIHTPPNTVTRGKAGPALFVQILPYIEGQSPLSNGEVFAEQARLPGTFGDGTSNTIAFAEHYALDCYYPFDYSQGGLGYPWRATFADKERGDVVPETQGNPPITMPATRPTAPVPTFQVAPRPKDCAWFIPQTPHPAGMLVALADGSVRQLASSISTSTFWSAVTPNKGDMLGNNW